jgi:hypothetical protein
LVSPDWRETRIILPDEFASVWASRLSATQHHAARSAKKESGSALTLDVAELFEVFPVALLTAETN